MSVTMKRALIAASIAVLWLLAHGLKIQTLEARESWPDAEQFMIVPPAQVAPLLAIGFNEVAADITWARMLVYYGSARIGKSDLRYLDSLIENVLALDPYFKRVYAWAGAATTFKNNRATQEEFELSARYLRRGIERFPDDYDLYETLMLRLWWDLEPDTPEAKRANRLEAARLAEIAIRLPTAPPGAATRVATMWSELGEAEHAKRTLKQMLLTTENKEARAKMIDRFRNLFPADREANLMIKAKRELDRQHEAELPWGPSDLYILLGPRPKRITDLDQLSSQATVLGRLNLLTPTDTTNDRLDPASPHSSVDASTKTVPSP